MERKKGSGPNVYKADREKVDHLQHELPIEHDVI